VSAFLLDTNVISELIKPKPEPKVTMWIDDTDEELLFLSVLTFGEIRKGVVLLPRSARRTSLEAWLSKELPLRFSSRILDVDQEVADRWGHISGLTSARGVQLGVIDGLLAATAMQHDLTLVTRDTKEVDGTGVMIFNPWTYGSV
jgi:predicted nucleic acid-binding protein